MFAADGQLRLYRSSFQSDNECLDSLLMARKEEVSIAGDDLYLRDAMEYEALDNFSRCGRMPSHLWCFTEKLLLENHSLFNCFTSFQVCKKSHLQSQESDTIIATSCEQMTGSDVLKRM